MWLSERPESFEHKTQLKGARVRVEGKAKRSWDGDACELNYRLEFARNGENTGVVDEIENYTMGNCYTSELLSRAAWFEWGNGTYLRGGNELYRYGLNKQWLKESNDGYWSLSRFDSKKCRVIYKRAQDKRTFIACCNCPKTPIRRWLKFTTRTN